MGFSMQHLLLTLVIVILVFGTKGLKNAGSDLGGAIRGFRKAMKESGEEQNSLPVDDKAPESSEYSKEKDRA